MQFTLAHDDGQLSHDLESADIVLVGVSRTSKTPTSMYLANRGIRTAVLIPLFAKYIDVGVLEVLETPTKTISALSKS